MTTTINASTSSGLVNTADTSGILQLQTASTAALTIDASQNVGVGTTDMSVSGANAKFAVSGGVLNLDDSYAITWGGGTGRPSVNGNKASQYILINTNGSERMRITSAGNVGIGVTNPSQILQINGGSATQMDWYVGATRTGTVYTDNSQMIIDAVTAIPMKFRTTDIERMQITSAGELKLGGTGSLLGDNNQQFAITSTTCGISIQTSGNKAFATWTNSGSAGTGNAATIQQFFNNSAQNQVGTITSTGTNCLFNSTSDYRLKEDVTPIANGLSLISALNPVTFKWSSNKMEEVGFLAHEFQNVIPSFVTGDKDAVDENGKPVYQAMDSSGAIPLLVAAIQELKAIVDAQAAEITALKGAK